MPFLSIFNWENAPSFHRWFLLIEKSPQKGQTFLINNTKSKDLKRSRIVQKEQKVLKKGQKIGLKVGLNESKIEQNEAKWGKMGQNEFKKGPRLDPGSKCVKIRSKANQTNDKNGLKISPKRIQNGCKCFFLSISNSENAPTSFQMFLLIKKQLIQMSMLFCKSNLEFRIC